MALARGVLGRLDLLPSLAAQDADEAAHGVLLPARGVHDLSQCRGRADRGVRDGGFGATVDREGVSLACTGFEHTVWENHQRSQRTRASVESIRHRDAW